MDPVSTVKATVSKNFFGNGGVFKGGEDAAVGQLEQEVVARVVDKVVALIHGSVNLVCTLLSK